MKLANALALAVKAHAGVTRKYGDNPEPYSNHVIRVAFEVAKSGYGDDMIAAALLHDVLEDTDTPPEVISESVGEVVLHIVQELTNPSHLAEHKSKPRAVRKQIDRDHLAKVSHEAKVIKLADRIDNVADLTREGPADFKKKYAKESRALLEVLQGTNHALEYKLEWNIRSLEASAK